MNEKNWTKKKNIESNKNNNLDPEAIMVYNKFWI